MLLNNILKFLLLRKTSENYYFHDILLKNVVTRNHTQRLNSFDKPWSLTVYACIMQILVQAIRYVKLAIVMQMVMRRFV